MSKILPFVLALLSFSSPFITHAQNLKINVGDPIDFAAKKKGTLSVQNTTGNGANGPDPYWIYIKKPAKTYLCLNDPKGILLSDSSSNRVGSVKWFYDDQFYSSDSSITVTKPGLYKLVAGDSSHWDEKFITSTIPVVIPANTTFSPGGSVILKAPTKSADTSITNFKWYNGSNLLSSGSNDSLYTVSLPGRYYVQTTDANGCIQNSDAIEVNVETPSKSLDLINTSCTNGRLSIATDTATSLLPDSITWFKDNAAIQTFSNKGITVVGGNGKGDSVNQLNQPYGIFLDTDKNIYIADNGNYRIVKWRPNAVSGVIIADTMFLFPGVGYPNDIWLDDKHNLAVSTDFGVRVRSLLLPQVSKKPINYSNAPITGDANSNLYFCTTDSAGNFCVEKWNPDTGYDSIIVDNMEHPIYNPQGIAIDSANNVYIADEDPISSYGRVLKFAPGSDTGVIVAGADSSMRTVGKIAVNKQGNIFVVATADFGATNIQEWKANSTHGIVLPPSIYSYSNEYGGITMDNDGNLYVVDKNNRNVIKYLSQGIISGTFESKLVANGQEGPQINTKLRDPFGIFVDSLKNIFISDEGNNVSKWAKNANAGEDILRTYSLNISDSVADIWLDKNNHLFISDGSNILHIPLPLSSKINNSSGITGDANSNLYIAENGGIEKWNPFTNSDTLLGVDIVHEPNGIFIDSKKNIYTGDNLTDSEFNYYGRVLQFSANGAPVDSLGKNYSQIGAIGGIALDNEGNKYITDINNQRVLVWKKNAVAPVTIASGYMPWGIKLDNDGNIYVADQTNNRVVMYPSMIKNFISNPAPGVYKAKVRYPGGFTQITDSVTVTNCGLALQFLDFTGGLETNDVVLNWKTAQEINTNYFEVERSTDGRSYSGIANLNASFNSSMINNYSYVDRNAADILTGKLYYRLKEIDKDGSFTYSKIVAIDLSGLPSDFQISPNPAHNLLKINLRNISAPTKMIVTDVNGHRLMEQNIPVATSQTVLLNTTNLAPGTYFLRVIISGKIKEQKFIKL